MSCLKLIIFRIILISSAKCSPDIKDIASHLSFELKLVCEHCCTGAV